MFFPHGPKEEGGFDDEYELRDWLAGSLRLGREGRYRLKEAAGLGVLESGSLVFFVKNNYVVGLAVVEEKIRDITPQDNQQNGWDNDEGFKKVIKFFPDSIWAFPDNRFIPTSRVTRVNDNKGFGQGFTKIDDLSKFLDVLSLLKKTR